MLRLSTFQFYILSSRVNFSRVFCVFLNHTPSFCESVFVDSLVYVSNIYPHFVGLLYSNHLHADLHCIELGTKCTCFNRALCFTVPKKQIIMKLSFKVCNTLETCLVFLVVFQSFYSM